MLETGDHTVETYNTRARFLAEADRARLVCLVFDQWMPQIAGLDLLARLRNQGMAMPTVPIVSTPGPAVSRCAAELGVFEVLEQPLAREDLLAEVGAAVA